MVACFKGLVSNGELRVVIYICVYPLFGLIEEKKGVAD